MAVKKDAKEAETSKKRLKSARVLPGRIEDLEQFLKFNNIAIILHCI